MERTKNYNSQVTAVILAGGKSSRMGRDKAEMKIHGKTFLEIQLEKLKHIGIEEILISRKGFVEDIYPECGPLGGMHASFHKASCPNCLVISVDVPLVSEKHLEQLIASHLESHVDATITKNPKNGKIEPLIGVYRSSLWKDIDVILQGEDYAVFKLLKKVKYSEFPYAGDTEDLLNCNCMEEVQRLKGKIEN